MQLFFFFFLLKAYKGANAQYETCNTQNQLIYEFCTPIIPINKKWLLEYTYLDEFTTSYI